MEIVTLLALVLAIIIGFRKQINTGLVSILMAFIVGHFMLGLDGKEIVSGWPTNLFFILLGMTLLFGMAKANGTLTLITKKISSLAKGNTKLLPIIFFALTGVIAGIGPGNIAAVALMAPIAMELTDSEDIPEILMATMIISGSLAGALSPLAPTGIIAINLAAEQGLEVSKSIFLSCISTSVIMGGLFYFIFGGHKLQNKNSKIHNIQTFNREQKITSLIILLVIIGILVYKMDIGLIAFSGAVILLLLGVVDEKAAIIEVPWSTLILVSGVAVLVNVVGIGGGIDFLSGFLAKIMNEKTATSIMAITAGLMSAVSSASGVVLPTLIPTIPKIATGIGGNISEIALVSAIVVGAHTVTFSPLSTLGAIALSSSTERIDKQKFFGQLLVVGLLSVLLAGVLGFLGLYNIWS
ncbi:SLC13 family permease [Anaerosalibacter massiliensis]|uniref:SLC13 family permease n=1 Tax=Anaerosalibacter massiliensis TaxID=1347392 RepID=A0A9X2S6H4_9FIRM|nr:SLC13 family permease [Anaerosalibacter massiliensis]MCR2043066.1 SLC13 family permease [Anaerosalibacter massiliensis]